MPKELRNLGITLIIVIAACLIFYKFIYTTDPVLTTQTNSTSSIPMVSNLASLHSFSYGPIDAKVTVVEFFDPECESCAAVAPYLTKEMEFYKDKVRWVFRYMAYHKNSKTAIRVLEAARKQNLFLEVQHTLFENQKNWGEQQVSTEVQILETASKIKSINMDQLKKDMSDSTIEDIINSDATEGTQAGVKGTPTFFINGVILEEFNFDLLIQKINERL